MPDFSGVVNKEKHLKKGANETSTSASGGKCFMKLGLEKMIM